MAKFLKKQNIVITVGTYKNKQGEEKKRYRTVGELVTMQDDDGSTYQFGEIFYPNTKFSIYDSTDREQPKKAIPTIQQDPMEAQDNINPKNIPF